MYKFIYSFSIIIFGLALGYIIQVLVNRQIIKLPLPMDRHTQITAVYCPAFPQSSGYRGRNLDGQHPNVRIAAFPFLGLFALILGGMLALGAAKLLKLEPR